MRDPRSAMGAPITATFGAEDVAPTGFLWYGALAIGVILVVVSLLAMLFGRAQGPEVKPLIPLAAGIWSLADMLTAFLLLAQFYVNGRRFFGLLAVAYACTGLLTCPYVAAFPGLFQLVSTVGDAQTSIYLWSTWHCLFPALIIGATIGDSSLRPIVSRTAIRTATIAFVITPVVVAAAVALFVFTHRTSLPHLIVNNQFQPFYRALFLPLVIAVNGFACMVLLKPSRLTSLKVCLALAVSSAGLDAALNLTSNAYSYAWDTSKLITVFTGSVVLIMMLCDIAQLYGRLARIANIDVLTSLQNRRALEEYIAFAYTDALRRRGTMSLLVIDIDHFKGYNDSFGHFGGDECLRRVARAIAECVTRPLDVVGRFGGEEFVVVLPDTPLQGVLILAERIRSVVGGLEMAYEGKSLGQVTVSVGVGFAADAGATDSTALFRAADRGLYDAKAGGRNRVVLGVIGPTGALGNALLRVPNAADLGLGP